MMVVLDDGKEAEGVEMGPLLCQIDLNRASILW